MYNRKTVHNIDVIHFSMKSQDSNHFLYYKFVQKRKNRGFVDINVCSFSHGYVCNVRAIIFLTD